MTTLGLALLLLAGGPAPFTNVAEAWGLTGVSSGRATFVDLNCDGQLDVVLDRQYVFLQHEGRFVAGPALPVVGDVVLFADYDNDGDPDLFAGAFCEPTNPKWTDHGRSNEVWLNEGDAGWRCAGVVGPRTSVHAACTLDYDRDGVLDLFVGSGYVVYGASLDAHPDRLYRGHGDGTFEDVTADVGLNTDAPVGGNATWSKPTYGVTHGDFDGDGWQDLWVCTYGRQWNHLWRNEGGEGFLEIGARTGFDGDADRSGKYPEATKRFFREQYGSERQDEPPFRSNGNTFDCAIADYDNDGDLDCILAEITHAWAGPSSDRTSLLVNLGDRFERRPDAFARTHQGDNWNQGDLHAAWLDYDNDGLLDALIASSDYPDGQELKLYRQKEDHTFEPARTFGWEGAAQLSVGDFDRDGDVDILCGRSLMRLSKEKREELGPSCALFRNDYATGNGWLEVELVGGGGTARDGIGCRIRVTTGDGVTQTREIRGGCGHAGHNDPYVAHFGLGKNPRVELLEVLWQDSKGSATRRTDVEAGQRIVVSYGQDGE